MVCCQIHAPANCTSGIASFQPPCNIRNFICLFFYQATDSVPSEVHLADPPHSSMKPRSGEQGQTMNLRISLSSIGPKHKLAVATYISTKRD